MFIFLLHLYALFLGPYLCSPGSMFPISEFPEPGSSLCSPGPMFPTKVKDRFKIRDRFRIRVRVRLRVRDMDRFRVKGKKHLFSILNYVIIVP